MKALTSSIVQLFAIIFITITFAVSVAAFSMWADSGADVGGNQPQAVGLVADAQ